MEIIYVNNYLNECMPVMSFDTTKITFLLNLHNDLGTKHSLINRLMTIIHENGEKGLQNE